MNTLPGVKGRLGFGCMRLPMKEGEVDLAHFSEMVDAYMAAGFHYFDTAHGYISGKSETAIKAALTSRYPRESYVLTNKLSAYHFEREEEIRPLFESQLAACGVEYFDYYLMHAQCKSYFEKYKSCHAYEIALELLREGKIRHFGISFHDTPEVLAEILEAYPEIEVVQIQFNYVDFDDPAIRAREVYEVCVRYGKPVIVMEPVKGGSLVKLPPEAQAVFDELGDGYSNAAYAIRFTADFPTVAMVLSGMGNMDMMRENIGFMKDFRPLSDKEKVAIGRVQDVFRSMGTIPCTACGYCTERCPVGIRIPSLFGCLNDKAVFKNWSAGYYYDLTVATSPAPDACLACGACEEACPQHLKIRSLLAEVSRTFQKKAEE
ncbi:MAG: aldo/keto reductase [Clostridia bacterium]|nr:aldo/keto reductase [Clostridia bacterium]